MEKFIEFLAEKFYYVFLGIMAVYVVIRFRKKPSEKKLRIFFILGLGAFLTYFSAVLVIKAIFPEWGLFVVLAAVIAGLIYFCRKNWCFRMNCAECGKRLDWNTIFIDDRNLCIDCLAERHRTE